MMVQINHQSGFWQNKLQNKNAILQNKCRIKNFKVLYCINKSFVQIFEISALQNKIAEKNLAPIHSVADIF